MCRFAICLIIFLAAPSLALSGAWPRAEGSSFLSSGFALLDPQGKAQQQEQTLFFERGLKKQRTFGFSGSFNGASSGEGHFFLRLPPKPRPNGALTALEFGFGVKSVDAKTFQPLLKTGFSWSKGITVREKSGWLSLDSAVLWNLGTGDHSAKLDATFGLSVSERLKLIAQGFAEITANGESLTMSPSLAYRFGKGKTHLQLGVERKFGTGSRSGVRIGLWREF